MAAGSLFGQAFRIQSFGESHGPALGVVIDGCPSGVSLTREDIQSALDRRKPGTSAVVSQRKEQDQVEILSGIFEGLSLGTPIAMMVRNQDARSEDYEKIKFQDRPGHADDLWREKFGHRDHRGGGRSSGRETVARVMAGAVAEKLALQLAPQIELRAWVCQVGTVIFNADRSFWPDQKLIDQSPARMPDQDLSSKAEQLLVEARGQGKSYGGVAQFLVKGLPKALGQPVFHKFKADLAQALMSVGATSALGFGEGFEVAEKEGSQFHRPTDSDPYGGDRGGLTTGEDLRVKLYFKPTSSVLSVATQGRHDPCIVPRAIVAAEAMLWLVIADHLLLRRLDRL